MASPLGRGPGCANWKVYPGRAIEGASRGRVRHDEFDEIRLLFGRAHAPQYFIAVAPEPLLYPGGVAKALGREHGREGGDGFAGEGMAAAVRGLIAMAGGATGEGLRRTPLARDEGPAAFAVGHEARLAALGLGLGPADLREDLDGHVGKRGIAERSGRGVVCFISNFSWLGDASFVVMRQRLLQEFDAIWIDNLNGDSRETGKQTPEGKPDPSIFSTEQNREGIRVSLLGFLDQSSSDRAIRSRVHGHPAFAP